MKRYDSHDLRGDDAVDALLDAYARKRAAEFRVFLEDPEPVDAPELFQRMEQDMERQRRKDRRARTRRRCRNVAAGFVLACVVSLFALDAVGAINLPFVGWFQEQLGTNNRTGTNIDLDYLRALGIAYAPTWLPEGYSLDSATTTEEAGALGYSRITFVQADRDRLGYLDQLTSEITVSYDAEHGQRVRVGERDGYLTTHQDTAVLIWKMDDDQFVLTVPHDVDAVRIAESVKNIA